MTTGIRNAVLAASLLVAAPAVAAQPDGDRHVWVPAGTTVVLVPPGSGVVVTSITTGRGACRRAVIYLYPGNGGQQQVKVSHTGNACGARRPADPIGVAQPVRPPQITPTQPAPRRERLWTLGYPPKPVTPATPPRL